MGANPKSLRQVEQELLRETDPERLQDLSAEELAALQRRIRRARDKYVGIYRRTGSRKVAEKGGRGLAKSKNSRNAARANEFEDALQRVNVRLAKAEGTAAAELRQERLAAARPAAQWPGAAQDRPAKPAKTGARVVDRRPRGAGTRRRKASTQALGARRQAKRDAR